MKLKRYNQFLGLETLNENLDKAKKFLKEREILLKAAKELNYIDEETEYEFKEGKRKSLTLKEFSQEQQDRLKQKFRDIRLSDDEIKRIEQNEEFIKLRNLFSDNLGYLYNFTYMYFVEMSPFDEIEAVYKDLIEYKDLLANMKDLPEIGKSFDLNFIDAKIPNTREHRNNYEILVEAIEGLKTYRKVKKILDSLPSKLKKSYKESTTLLKEQFAMVAKAFDDLPEDLINEKDPQTGKQLTKKDRVWRNFFGEMRIDTNELTLTGNINPKFGNYVFQSRLRRFETESNPIRSFIEAANTHLKSSMSDFYQERIEKINKTQDTFGRMGVNILKNINGVIIVEVFTHAANKFLNGHTNHCIVTSSSQWDHYLGEYNKQYYLYNTNLLPTAEESTIGVTIKPDRTFPGGGCQGASNQPIGGRFKDILKKWQKEYDIEENLFDYLKPMSVEEVEKRKKAKVAEREIVKKGISIDLIKQYVRDDGADINKDNSQALKNAVEEDDYEKAKVCLELGASPNHQEGSESIMARAKSIEIIKLLIAHGSEMTGSIFQIVIGDKDTLEYCLKAGMDSNFQNGLPGRAAVKGSYRNSEDIGESYNESFELLVKYGARYEGRDQIRFVRGCAEYARLEMIDYLLNEVGMVITKPDWENTLRWLRHGSRINEEARKKVVEYLENKVAE